MQPWADCGMTGTAGTALSGEIGCCTPWPADPPVDPLTYRVLRYVDAAPDETVRVRHIGELLLCDRARASRVVHRLVDQGLLTLQVSQADARQRQLDLTAAGTTLLA